MINLRNQENGNTLQRKLGLAWPCLVFGPAYSFYYKEWKEFVVLFILTVITLGISNVVLFVIYHKMHAYMKIRNGYLPPDNYSMEELQKIGLCEFHLDQFIEMHSAEHMDK